MVRCRCRSPCWSRRLCCSGVGFRTRVGAWFGAGAGARVGVGVGADVGARAGAGFDDGVGARVRTRFGAGAGALKPIDRTCQVFRSASVQRCARERNVEICRDLSRSESICTTCLVMGGAPSKRARTRLLANCDEGTCYFFLGVCLCQSIQK